jgi:hypothetical protein
MQRQEESPMFDRKRLAQVALICELLWSLTAAMDLEAGQPRKDAPKNPLDPCGRIHVPIGIANTVDALKTFVEAEGGFSPGFGTYGICFWVFDPAAGKLTAPTMDGVKVERGLSGQGYLIPWSAWEAAGLQVKTEVCEVKRDSPAGPVFVVGARVQVTNPSPQEFRLVLYAELRALGPAGGPVKQLAVSDDGTALLVDGHPALVANEKPAGAGVSATDAVRVLALEGKLSAERAAASETGDCSGALRWELSLAAHQARTLSLVCPVLPGRRAAGHQWSPGGNNNYKELAVPNPTAGGVLQPDPGLPYYRGLSVDQLFAEAHAYWREFTGHARLKLPDPRWAEAFAAITGHVGMCLNEGAPDVAVINYTTFNRDGVYSVNILQKAGLNDLAGEAVAHFLKHPLNGRPYPEADNPGQDLWILGQHWLFTRDRAWLAQVYPSVRKLAALITYYRTTPPPHWVNLDGLEFGEALPKERRHELKPGSCDGHHPEYTEAFDIAGLRAAAALAAVQEQREDAAAWSRLADTFFRSYDQRFGAKLAAGYGSYSVLWPCQLYPRDSGKAFEQFRNIGAKGTGGWRYFPLATAHQGLLAGSRTAGHGTVKLHLDHEQMRGWYVFDEGGGSGPGGWGYARTRWRAGVAMPHGWAIAELFLLLRDCLVFEDGDRLILLAGIPEDWFTPQSEWSLELPTCFGRCVLTCAPQAGGALVKLAGGASPPGGFVLCVPDALNAQVSADGKPAQKQGPLGEWCLPNGTREAKLICSRNARP